MADITVKWSGISDILAALETVKAQVNTATRKATQQSGDLLRSDARRNFTGYHAPGFHHVGDGDKPNRVTGDLQASIIPFVPVTQEGNAKYYTTIGPTAIYARVIELGATISPTARAYLSWFDVQLGVRRFEKEVTIPPRPYFTPAVLSLSPKMESLFYAAWRGALELT